MRPIATATTSASRRWPCDRHPASDGRGGHGSPGAPRALGRRAARRLPRRDRRAGRGAPLLPADLRRAGRGRDSDRPEGRHLDEGRRDHRGLADPRGVRARLRRDRRGTGQGGRPHAARQDEHRRVRDGVLDGELGLGAFAKSLGSDARPRRVRRRNLCGGLGGARSVGARVRHRRLDQAAVGAVRERGPAADVRDGLALRRGRVRLEPRPDRARREDGARRRAASTPSSRAAIRGTPRRRS